MNSSITIHILDKEYSLRIDSQDEKLLRQAAEVLNQRLATNRKKWGIINAQDLLAIAAFDTTVDLLRKQQEEDRIAQKMEEMRNLFEGLQDGTEGL